MQALDDDRTKTFTAEISKLGLVEMTRQNVTEGVREIMSRPCPTCHGDGVIKSEETIAIEFERQLREIASRAKRGTEAFLVQMNPRVSAKFTGEGARAARAGGRDGQDLPLRGFRGLAAGPLRDHPGGASQDIEERAIPFKEGDEVLVNIVEPHMYEVDDAVAKIDGYIISVVNGGRFVGTKKLVRIEEAGRTAAVATLIDSGEEEGGPDGESLESKPRRRGRRGGRRRSAVKAEATSE